MKTTIKLRRKAEQGVCRNARNGYEALQWLRLIQRNDLYANHKFTYSFARLLPYCGWLAISSKPKPSSPNAYDPPHSYYLSPTTKLPILSTHNYETDTGDSLERRKSCMYNCMDTHFRALGSLSLLATPCYLIEDCSRGKREWAKIIENRSIKMLPWLFQIYWVLNRMALVRITEQDLISIDVVGVCTLICTQGLYISRYIPPKCKVRNVYSAYVLGKERPSPHKDRTSHLA